MRIWKLIFAAIAITALCFSNADAAPINRGENHAGRSPALGPTYSTSVGTGYIRPKRSTSANTARGSRCYHCRASRRG